MGLPGPPEVESDVDALQVAVDPDHPAVAGVAVGEDVGGGETVEPLGKLAATAVLDVIAVRDDAAGEGEQPLAELAVLLLVVGRLGDRVRRSRLNLGGLPGIGGLGGRVAGPGGALDVLAVAHDYAP